MKLFYILISFVLVNLPVTNAQNFTVIDTLPEGAYGAAAWGDYDNDGDKDLVYIAQAIPDFFTVYENVNNIFIPVPQYFSPMFNSSAKWADLDNDGFEDLVVNGMDTVLNAVTKIWKSNGNGTFSDIPNSIPGFSAGSVAIADYNNDGWNDIAVTGNDNAGAHGAFIFRNNGNLSFTDINASLTGVHFGELQWGDFNNDSLPDLVINGIHSPSWRVRIYQNMNNDVFQELPQYIQGSAGTVDWLDYDNDGWLDLLISGYDSTSVHNLTHLHKNNGNGIFTLQATTLPVFGEPSGAAVADFNNDGNVDVCFIGSSDLNPVSFSAFAEGNGTSNFNILPFTDGNIMNPFAEASDIDNDGDVDLIFGTYILLNNQVTGIKENILLSEINIFPNPSSAIIHFKTDMEDVKIFDNKGSLVLSNPDKTRKLDLTGFETGLYFIRAVEDEIPVQGKVMLVR